MDEKRRAERLEGRFTVAVREKLATWVTRTEDVSARGCQIELRRPLAPGMLVQLVFDMGPGVEPLVAHAQVAWARKTAPLRAGLTFLSAPRQGTAASPGGSSWIDRLLSAQVRRLADVPAVPGVARVPGDRTRGLDRSDERAVIVPPAPAA